MGKKDLQFRGSVGSEGWVHDVPILRQGLFGSWLTFRGVVWIRELVSVSVSVSVSENLTLSSIFLSQMFTHVSMSVTCLKAQVPETQQREQGLKVTSARLPPVVPVDLLPLPAVIACGIGHFHMARASSRLTVLSFKKNQQAEGPKSTPPSTTSRT